MSHLAVKAALLAQHRQRPMFSPADDESWYCTFISLGIRQLLQKFRRVKSEPWNHPQARHPMVVKQTPKWLPPHMRECLSAYSPSMLAQCASCFGHRTCQAYFLCFLLWTRILVASLFTLCLVVGQKKDIHMWEDPEFCQQREDHDSPGIPKLPKLEALQH